MGFQAIKMGLTISAPLLLTALLTGLVVSILQASTQINEMTLSFIPKILAIVAIGIALGPWMLNIFLDYMRTLFNSIPYIIG
ncbi:flagellar biosynthesis protein FliQ [Pluralibacter gergoviae]|nr:flagellar biosynthetic protein FliQ [Pluralibacter gergoviae]OUF48274.1 flagellar biosynthetic protein FliQ [Pluralibacter gergoviae]SUB69479.1 Flagellar biosynthetic protein FliQ [Pluralibacter gergoviae]